MTDQDCAAEWERNKAEARAQREAAGVVLSKEGQEAVEAPLSDEARAKVYEGIRLSNR